jgi:hypothetical protein
LDLLNRIGAKNIRQGTVIVLSFEMRHNWKSPDSCDSFTMATPFGQFYLLCWYVECDVFQFFFATSNRKHFCTHAQLFLVVKTLESMISRPLVEKSRELNMPSWLLLPTVGCFGFGFLYAFSPTSVLNTQSTALSELSWIAPLFIVTSGMFLLLALLAWFLRSYPILSTRRKQHKSIVTIAFILDSFRRGRLDDCLLLFHLL